MTCWPEPVTLGAAIDAAWASAPITPILLAAASVNQRLPSGPTAIPTGWLEAVGVANSLIAWVVGLISPILLEV